MTHGDLKFIVENYLSKLEYMYPPIKSENFKRNTYAKWACKELLREISVAQEGLPFRLDPIELLDNFVDKMNRYACLNRDNSEMFLAAADTAEILIEEAGVRKYRI